MQKEVFGKKQAVLNEAVTVFVFRMDGKKKWPGEGIIPVCRTENCPAFC